MPEMFRQGDVLITRLTQKDAQKVKQDKKYKPLDRENGRLVLAHGEATGHAHAIEEAEASILAEDQDEMKQRFLVVEREAHVTHEEHTTIDLSPGMYRITRQREYVEKSRPRRVYD